MEIFWQWEFFHRVCLGFGKIQSTDTFFELIWGKCISPSISIFLWRLFANRIPVDLKLQWRGNALASKCRCCSKPSEESRLHLFVNGELARRVWSHFDRWFPQVPSGGGLGINLDLRFRRWQRYLNICSSQHLSALLPYLILWAIWTERNENVHRNKPLEAENVIRKVSSLLRNLVLAKLVGPEQWRDCSPRLEIMNGQVQEKSKRRTRMVLWRPPDPRWVKLNVDGAFLSSSQVGGGGGVVRDSEGEILSAFSAGLKAGSGLEAEAAAVLIGIHLAKQFGNQIWIELDSEVVVRWLTEDQLGSADSCIILAKIRRELGGTIWRASHIFREGNKVADLLAKIGLQSDFEIIYTRISTPPRAKALCRMDQWGLPNFRF